jgi:hypothetical protein
MYRAFTFNTLPLAAEFVTIAVADVPMACTADFPKTLETANMFGAAILTS